jgi:hypothetical protein
MADQPGDLLLGQADAAADLSLGQAAVEAESQDDLLAGRQLNPVRRDGAHGEQVLNLAVLVAEAVRQAARAG